MYEQSPLTIGDEFGCSIANIGDLNRDGIPDLAVGACGDTDVVRFLRWQGEGHISHAPSMSFIE